jgi:hypothetical protein
VRWLRKCRCWRSWRLGHRRRSRPSERGVRTRTTGRRVARWAVGEARTRAAAGFARARASGLLPCADPRRDPRRSRGRTVCPRCGAGYAAFGQECCEQIDWQVRLIRIVVRRPTYRRTCRCAVRGVLVAPPVPKAIAKGRFTTGFLARLLVEKFVLGRPAPDRRRAGPRRARSGQGHPGRGVRGVLGSAGGRDQ